MFEDRSHTRTFYSAPQSVTSLVAAVLEPAIAVAVYLLAAWWFDEPVMRPDLLLCLLAAGVALAGVLSAPLLGAATRAAAGF